jgi:hypothetical protein
MKPKPVKKPKTIIFGAVCASDIRLIPYQLNNVNVTQDLLE